MKRDLWGQRDESNQIWKPMTWIHNWTLILTGCFYLFINPKPLFYNRPHRYLQTILGLTTHGTQEPSEKMCFDARTPTYSIIAKMTAALEKNRVLLFFCYLKYTLFEWELVTYAVYAHIEYLMFSQHKLLSFSLAACYNRYQCQLHKCHRLSSSSVFYFLSTQ